MKNEFVTYEIAISLKEIGFEEMSSEQLEKELGYEVKIEE